ncbi:MAG: metal-dependent transcriptional regulator [Oscillospiraceae bacterium]|nr:metal-dependent transcriptional regulator [Oscillospiraceae bacterium]
MKICASQCRYLLCIYHLEQEHARIRCADIARNLGVTRPSVSKMMKCMVSMELVHPDYCESVRLLPKGREFAEQFRADYDLVYLFFRRILRLPSQEARDHAYLFLSTFPEHTIKKLCSSTSRTLKQVEQKQHNK